MEKKQCFTNTTVVQDFLQTVAEVNDTRILFSLSSVWWLLSLLQAWWALSFLLRARCNCQVEKSYFLNMAGAQSHKRKVAFPAVSLGNPSQSLLQPAVCCHTPANILITQQAYTFSFKLIQVDRFEPPQLKTNVIILSTQAHSRNKHKFINLSALASPRPLMKDMAMIMRRHICVLTLKSDIAS